MHEAGDAAIERLSAAVAEAAERAAAQQGADTSALTEAADHLARTAESLTPAVEASIGQVDASVGDALRSVEATLTERMEQSGHAARAATEELRNVAEDAQDRLRVWLAGALPEAISRISTGLIEHLERAEARLDETAGRLEAGTEAAGARMTEAAKALTAVAGDSVGSSERRLSTLNEQIDALIQRLDVVADAEGRRADAAEELLAKVQAGEVPTGAAPATAEGLDEVVRRLAAQLDRAEEVERRLADELDRAAVRVETERPAEPLVPAPQQAAAASAPRRDQGGRLLGGLRSPGTRKREPEPPMPPRQPGPPAAGTPAIRPDAPQPPAPRQAVRPPGQPVPPPADAATPARDYPVVADEGKIRRPVRAPQQLPACDVCGFVARNAGGLAAHRRTHD
jgi:chromosome segregation ATPase